MKQEFEKELEAISDGLQEAGTFNAVGESTSEKDEMRSGGDRVEASIGNVARATEKLFCLKGWYDKGDQFPFAGFMVKNYPGVLLTSLEGSVLGNDMIFTAKPLSLF